MLIPLFSLVLLSLLGQGYPNGAPCSQIDNMTPRHGWEKSPGRAPYRIQLGVQCYMPGHTIRVTLRGHNRNHNIKGFVLQARGSCPKTNETRIGSFVGKKEDWRYQCKDDKSSITHKGRVDKNKIEAEWSMVVGEEEIGQIRFVATVVKDYSKFWVMAVKSKVLNPCGQPSITCNGPPPNPEPPSSELKITVDCGKLIDENPECEGWVEHSKNSCFKVGLGYIKKNCLKSCCVVAKQLL